MKHNNRYMKAAAAVMATLIMTAVISGCTPSEPDGSQTGATVNTYSHYSLMPMETDMYCAACGKETEHLSAGVVDGKKCIGYFQCTGCETYSTVGYGLGTYTYENREGISTQITVECETCGKETTHYFTGAYDRNCNVNYQCSECYAIRTFNYGQGTNISSDYSALPLSYTAGCEKCQKETVHYFTGRYDDRNIGTYQCSECLKICEIGFGRT